MHSKYKFYSGFVVKYDGNILKLQTKEDSWPYFIIGGLLTACCVLFLSATRQIIFTAFMLITGLGLILYGVLTYHTTWTFDRLSGLLTYKKLGGPAKVYALDDILDVLLDSRKRGRHNEYRVVLKMSNLEWMPLSAFGQFDPHTEAQIAIREFLKMEEQDVNKGK